MKPSSLAKPPRNFPKGFALVVSLTMLVLLTVIAVGLLSLSAITLRTSTQGAAQAEAQANARLALMIAIGELQKHTGPDTRVTAPANLVNENYPPLLGVWRSWEGTNHQPNGRPIAPKYDDKERAESQGGRFIDWLVSRSTPSDSTVLGDAPNLVKTAAASDTVPLLAGGSLSSADLRQIHVVPTRLANGSNLAWWISGENQKARLAQPYKPRSANVVGLMEMGQTHSIANPAAFGLPSLMEDPEPHNPGPGIANAGSKAISRQSMALIEPGNPGEAQKKFHEFTTNSVGLLTNTATGGWRKDLSLLTERWDSIYSSYPGGRLPLFRLAPTAGSTTLVPLPTSTATNHSPAQSNLYPWSSSSRILGLTDLPSTFHAASASWLSLRNFATAYQKFTINGDVVKSPFVWDAVLSRSSTLNHNHIFNYRHTQRLHPQVARFQFLVYVKAVEDPARMDQNPKRFQMRFMYVPIFTLWNPYNVSLEQNISSDQFVGFGWRRAPPGVMAAVNQATFPDPDLVPNNQYRLFTPGNFQAIDRPGNNVLPYDTGLAANVAKGYNQRWADKRTFGCYLPTGVLSFKPGEVKVFSPEFVDPVYPWSGVMRLSEGYNPSNILGVDFAHSSNLQGAQRFWFLMKTDKMTQPFFFRDPGIGFSLSFGDGGTNPHFGGGSMPTALENEFHNLTTLTSEGQGNIYWPPTEVDEVAYSVAELASGPWVPLFSVSFGPRLTIGTGPGTKQNRSTKGVVQSNPLSAMVLGDPASGAAKDHPANGTYDITYHSLSLGSTVTPNLSQSKGFIATGYQSGDGLSRLIMCDIPLRPMASLMELQGWNPRGQNPYPPFQHNLIGNSDATPLIPMNNIVPRVLSPDTIQTNLQHDDAYCANHLLFDDWFLSSIAPVPAGFRAPGRDIQTVYREFLKGERRLVNRAYLPIAADRDLTDAEAGTRIADIVSSRDGWLKAASRFEVEGMFNVNSTSVLAWKALLGRAKTIEQIAMHGADSMVTRNISSGHVVSRGAVAPDVEAGSNPAFGGQFANASEFTGYRNLSDDQIEDLATKIVEQVRLRGPFLSLSEFVNRQLSSNENLALAGAVQSAIDSLATDPMAVLRNPNNSLSANTMSPLDPKLVGVNYAFAKAAEGSSAHGAPGWIRQADILRPIAPVLSVRDDTFTIRAYGDAVDRNGKVIARAWCEAVVKRTRNFTSSSDAADSIDPPTHAGNQKFGRRYEIISYRWLNPDEV